MSVRTLGSLDGPRRRSPRGGRLLILLALLIVAVVAAAVAWAARAAQAEVAALRADLDAANARLAAVEGRLAAAEAAATQQASDLSAATGRLSSAESALDGLSADVAALRRAAGDGHEEPLPEAEAPPPPEIRLSVARQTQSHPLSCESSAASMAAAYLGVPLSEADILTALPRSDNPHLGFRGSVDGAPGGLDDYGVYAGPVAAVLTSRGLRATPIEGGLAGIQAALARGNPVVAWISYNCIVSTPVQTTVDGQDVVLVPYQHAVVVTGYGADGVYANDPYDGGEDFYATADFERALAYFGDMAIEVALP